MRQLHQSIVLYAESHGGRYPDSVETLFLHGDVSADGFLCPSSNDERTPGGTPGQQAARLTAEPGHLSYVYLGKGLTLDTAGDDGVVVMYEKPDNHAGDGMNVLFADGHVDWLAGRTDAPGTSASRIHAQAEAGTSPVRWPVPAGE